MDYGLSENSWGANAIGEVRPGKSISCNRTIEDLSLTQETDIDSLANHEERAHMLSYLDEAHAVAEDGGDVVVFDIRSVVVIRPQEVMVVLVSLVGHFSIVAAGQLQATMSTTVGINILMIGYASATIQICKGSS